MGLLASTRWTSCLFLIVIWVHQIVGPPAVIKQAPANNTIPDHPDNLEKPEDDVETKYNLEYNRYLKEVVDALESDPEFRRKLETAEEVDFRNGKVASELEYVNHHVRTKLDELKRTELSRLRELLKMQEEKKKAEENPDHHGHVDHSNPHTFEIQDLQMLMNKVRKDLEEADETRRQEFKEYEMQKEFEKEQKMKEMDEEHKNAYLKTLEEEQKANKDHERVRPLHHPGSQAQLEEVWEKTDQMSQKFDPKAFFYLHDLDGNGYWDEQEVNALFIKELDKIYANTPNHHVDMREREEEMERMREHVFKETDTNHDRFISYDEFLDQTKRDEWRRDEGWESIDQKPQFTQKEYEEFEKRRQMEVQQLVDQGYLPPHPAGYQYQYVHPNQLNPSGQQDPYQYVHPNQPLHPAGYHPGPHHHTHSHQLHPDVARQMSVNQAQYAPQYQAHPAAQQQYPPHPAAQQQGHPAAGKPQYQAHPAAGQPQYQAHPAAGQPQYQAHPAAGQPQYQAHPAAGQPQYQAHPAAGQPQYQAHPAAGQPQYQAHPAAGQPQYQAHPAAGQPQYQAHPAAQQQYQAHPQQQYHPNQVPQYQAVPVGQQPPQQQQYQPPSNQAPPNVPASQTNQVPPASKPQSPPAAQQGSPQGQPVPNQGVPVQSGGSAHVQPPSEPAPNPAQNQGHPPQTGHAPDPSKNNEIPHGN